MAGLLASGCWFHGPGDVRREISRSTGTEYSTEIGLTLGRTSMAIARWGLRTAGEDEVSLKGVRKVQVGIYHPVGPAASDPLTCLPGWEPVVRMHEDGESVLVMVQERGDRIRGMLVIVDDADELVVVRMRGRLERVLKEAMELGFEQADRPDLYEPALEHAEREI
jgi:hypothetical protein